MGTEVYSYFLLRFLIGNLNSRKLKKQKSVKNSVITNYCLLTGKYLLLLTILTFIEILDVLFQYSENQK